MAGHWSRVARTPVSAAVMIVLTISSESRPVLTARVAARFFFAQIGARVVRWRGGGSPGGGRARKGLWILGRPGSSYRDVPVLAPRTVDLLVPRLFQAARNHAPRLRGIDHVVDHRPTSRHVRVDLRAHRREQRRRFLLGVGRVLDLLFKDDF